MSRTALVTGAARRIGAHIARTLAQDGYTLHLHTGSDTSRVRALADEITTTYDVPVVTHVLDLAVPEQVASWAGELRTGPYAPQVIVNNASEFPGTATKASVADLDALQRALNIHLIAPIVLAHILSDTYGGHIVNILDARLDLLDGDRPGYEIGKRALADYTLRAAREQAPRVRINAIAPGLVLPPHGRDANYLARLARQRSVMGGPARLGDIGNALRYLEHASSVTGQILYVDAGEHLGPPTRKPTASPATVWAGPPTAISHHQHDKEL